MTKILPTTSEKVFEKLCVDIGLFIDKVPEVSHKKTPDFKVSNGSIEIYAEVKQHESSLAKQAKKWTDENPNQVRIGNVDFKNTGRMDRILRKQKDQLAEAHKKGLPTLAVIYPEEVMGPTDFECQIQLDRGLAEIPDEVSAVMYIENELVEYTEPEPKFKLYSNPKALIPFPKNFF